MNRTINWNILAAAAAAAGVSFFGVATAEAAPPPPPAAVTGTETDCTTGGAKATRCQTNGSTALRTSPAPTAAGQRTYGPYVSPDMVWIVAD